MFEHYKTSSTKSKKKKEQPEVEYVKEPEYENPHPKKENDNRFGAKTFTEEDTEVLDDVEKIVFIFHVAEESASSNFVDLTEFKKYYELLEKGYTLSEYQKRRINNANLFSKKRHEKLVSLYLELETASEKNKSENEKKEKEAFSAFSPDA